MDAVPDGKPEWAQTRREKERAALEAAGLTPRRRRWPWLLALALMIAAAAGLFWLYQARLRQADAPAPAPAAEQASEPVMQLTPGEITEVWPQLLQQTVRVTGSLAPQRQSQLTSEVPGRVNSVNVRPGDKVSAGDVLVQIDVESLGLQAEQQRSTAEATRTQLALAEAKLQRTRALLEKGFTTASALDEAEASVNQLRANLAALEGQVAAAEISVGDATVVAPFDGTVAQRSVDPGESVAVGAPLVTIVDLSNVEAQTFAPVGASARIEQGQQVALTIEGIPDRTFEGRVERISPVAAEGTRTIPVYISLGNPDGLLRGGMFASGEIVVAEEAEALALPPAALKEDGEGNYVLKVEDDRLVRQPVEPRRQWNGGRLVEIGSGLSAGDVVVSAALPQLEPGSRIAMVGAGQ